MTHERGADGPHALPFYIASCEPEISGGNCLIPGCAGLHFETSVSICNASPCQPEICRTLLNALLAGLNGPAGDGNRSASDVLTPGEMFMTTWPR